MPELFVPIVSIIAGFVLLAFGGEMLVRGHLVWPLPRGFRL